MAIQIPHALLVGIENVKRRNMLLSLGMVLAFGLIGSFFAKESAPIAYGAAEQVQLRAAKEVVGE